MIDRCEKEESLRHRRPTPFVPSPSFDDSSAAAQIAAIYEEFHGLLFAVCTAKFKLPADAAEGSIHDVMLALMQTGVRIDNVRSWLVAAACNVCRAYWRSRARHDFHVEATADIAAVLDGHDFAETHERQSLVRSVLRRLSGRQRLALHLHYFEGCTAREVAVRLNTTMRYAEKLIHKSLIRCREVLQEMSHAPRRSGHESSTFLAACQRGDRTALHPYLPERSD